MTTANESNCDYVDYLDSSAPSWQRPEGPPLVWRVIEGRKKTANGEILRFAIQEVPKELENDVVEFMVKYFIVEEPLCVNQGLAKDPLAVRETRTLWRDIVRQGVSVVALTLNSDPAAKPGIAGVNILGVVSADDQINSKSKMQFKAEVMKKVMGEQFKLVEETGVLRRYGVDRYLGAFGLSVHPSLRGQGLGEEILLARNDIGLAYQIPVSETIFTATASQVLAVRTGFEVLLERKFSELLDDEGKVAFPGVTVEFIKVMGKRLY